MSHSRKSTLRLKTKTERTASNDRRPEAPRVRTGARARAAARQELAARQAAAPAAPPAAPTPADHDKKAQSHPTARHTQPPPPRTASRRPQPGRPDTGDQGGAIARRTTTFRAFAPCPQGLEPCLADELKALGYDSVRAGRAGCHFEADWAGLLKANLQSRLATRILMQVAHASVHDEDDILALARSTPWEHWFGPRDSLRVDTSAIRSPMRSLQYCNLRAKDGICDRLREREGARPDIDTVRPDARVHLFLEERHATLYLDLSGESLFKRGWRLDKGVAPLRENLAAGMLALSGWRPDAPLLDPFCGSGTILIEAAWMALRVPPGIWRPFGFERLRQHDSRLWRDLKEDARSAILGQLPQPLVGCDLDPAAIEAAHANLRRAHLTPAPSCHRRGTAGS